MTSLILFAILTGPPVDSAVTLTLRIHLGRDHRSRIARHELACRDRWWISQRLAIQQHYRIALDDEANEFPTFQIGRGDDRHEFPPGSFAASGSFIKTLRSIADCHHWDRENPWMSGSFWADVDHLSDWQKEKYREHLEQRPEMFPPNPGWIGQQLSRLASEPKAEPGPAVDEISEDVSAPLETP